jgi:hypothetical protein
VDVHRWIPHRFTLEIEAVHRDSTCIEFVINAQRGCGLAHMLGECGQNLFAIHRRLHIGLHIR